MVTQQHIISVAVFFKKNFIAFKYLVHFTMSYFYYWESSKLLYFPFGKRLGGHTWAGAEWSSVERLFWDSPDFPQALQPHWNISAPRGNHCLLSFSANVLCPAMTLVCSWLWLVMTILSWCHFCIYGNWASYSLGIYSLRSWRKGIWLTQGIYGYLLKVFPST